jgi:aminoglycoside phosphotransferase (APT) family kinase protein
MAIRGDWPDWRSHEKRVVERWEAVCAKRTVAAMDARQSVATGETGTLLVEYLRAALGVTTLTLAEPLTTIGGGFDTSISAFRLSFPPAGWEGALILRVYRDGGDAQARFECAVHGAVAAQGFPVPSVLHMCEDTSVLGNAFVILERVPGVTMLARLLSPAMFRVAPILARLHARLHTLEPEAVAKSLRAAGAPLQSGFAAGAPVEKVIEDAQLAGLREAHAWLKNEPAAVHPPVVCHGDLHPLNIMMEGSTVTGVLDWANMRIGDPMSDVGATVALMTQGPIELPAPLQGIANVARRRIVSRYLETYAEERPLDMGVVRYFEAGRLFGFMLETGMYRQSRAGVIPPTTKRTAFNDPRVLSRIESRFMAITGVRPSVPEGDSG